MQLVIWINSLFIFKLFMLLKLLFINIIGYNDWLIIIIIDYAYKNKLTVHIKSIISAAKYDIIYQWAVILFYDGRKAIISFCC